MYQTPYDDNILGRGEERGGEARRQDPGPGWVGPGRPGRGSRCLGPLLIRDAGPPTNRCIF